MPKGKINIYECPAGHQTVTIDANEGTTPMKMACQEIECKFLSTSKFYEVDQSLTPSHMWYKPTDLKLVTDKRMLEYIKMGGLVICKIGEQPAVKALNFKKLKKEVKASKKTFAQQIQEQMREKHRQN